MNAIKLSIIILLTPFICFSQTKDKDVYFILNKNSSKYVIIPEVGKLENKEKSLTINKFFFYDRKDYENRQKEIEKDKKEGSYNELKYYKRLNESVFTVIKNKKEVIDHCDIHNLNIISYNWLIKNSWKENNSNILFKDLYFLLKIENNKFVKYKVARTVIAY